MVSYLAKVALSGTATGLCIGLYDVYSFWKKHKDDKAIVLASSIIVTYYGMIGGIAGLTLGYLTNY